ncbi:VWA domain-containing protein [Methylomicrobium sp. Wu6]|uniref:vWA domain-containing protein n=1 Tax=Methylomicrobium sp. Wu6 TaxID=3107928 RepID=UPI002DD62946|nr:VWA domain-containing protein [Methylomicrobium sp. Wu6]MEC4747602.1 VWA domain-containing protein [Methylomicrobium sp. Wu6]
MIHIVWPWLIAVLPLPWLIRRLVPPLLPAEQAALKVPFLDDFDIGKTHAVSQPQKWPLRLAMLAWLLLVIASMRPQWLGEPIEQAVSGRDIMLAIDLSGSMEEQDFVINKQQVDRLTAAKWVAGDFIERRVGDRMGLILFGTQAYLQTPLTFDRKTVKTLLDESAIGLAGDNTAIGDAIGLAVKRLKNQPANSRVLILMTDGANTAGEVSPLKAAELAADNQLKIYTIGIGADEMIVRSLFGAQKVNPSRDLDEKTLLDIAQKTGGRYFRARNTRELDNIYMLLDQLEPVNKDSQFFRPRSELFFWPLGLALGLAAVICLSRLRWS